MAKKKKTKEKEEETAAALPSSSSAEYPVFEEEQVPFAEEEAFAGAEFVDNPEPRCPCVLLLDTSSSMSGKPIEELNSGLEVFKDQLLKDDLAAKRVEVAVVAFGPVRVESDFQTPDVFIPPTLAAEGHTPMGEAIERAVQLIDERKETYRANGINYYRPWIFLITDGAPTDPWEKAAKLIKAGEQDGRFAFFPVGVQQANMDVLGKFGTRDPLKLKGLKFNELFSWLSRSLQKVSQSQLGTEVALPAPSSWAAV
jgi:uncharacterized protein YegL